VNKLENINWNLINNKEKGNYCFLIRIGNWAVELQEHEFCSLYELIEKINIEFSSIKNQLLDEELINLEFEKLPWYAELQGNKYQWSLRIIFESIEHTRSFEMYWPIQIAETLSIEIKKMWESMQKNN
tara:strand:- start:37 stop:420 length:384 start_codon:yes stop_codon:yes gene_type:complete